MLNNENLFDINLEQEIDKLIQDLTEKIEEIDDIDKKVDVINKIKLALHKISPFKDEPVDCVIWVKGDDVKANDYNPNKVATPEMKLLKFSIEKDGYTQPIVTYKNKDVFEIVDGFHRNRVGKEYKAIKKRLHGYLPVTIIKEKTSSLRDRISSTIRHNRARGVHGIDPMIDIVVKLLREGWEDEDICKELGMDADELLRFKQHSGLPELFKDIDYSKGWE